MFQPTVAIFREMTNKGKSCRLIWPAGHSHIFHYLPFDNQYTEDCHL